MGVSQLLALALLVATTHAFPVRPQATNLRFSSQSSTLPLYVASSRPRSRVGDPTGPTPGTQEDELETVDLADIPEMKYDEDKHPVAHQPWRRGITDGCEDPIDSEWRREAEDIIERATKMVGGTAIDVTWYLTHLLITIDDDWSKIPRDLLKSDGPVIEVDTAEAPMYYDPADPNPDPIYSERDAVEPVYERNVDQEDELKSKRYSRKEENEEELDLAEDEPSLYTSRESREDDAVRVDDEAELWDVRQERSAENIDLTVDTPVVSTIAGAIIDALETVEDRLRVLDRHEIVLSSPGPPDVLETQKQFDAHRGCDVAVQTQDPWDSNRTIRGKLIDRNSMDVLVNVKGRMVTVPLNFVRCVRLPPARRSSESDLGEFHEEEEDIYEE